MNTKKLLSLVQTREALEYILVTELQKYASTLVNTVKVPQPLSVDVSCDTAGVVFKVVSPNYSETFILEIGTEGFYIEDVSFEKAYDALRFVKHQILLDLCYNVVVTL